MALLLGALLPGPAGAARLRLRELSLELPAAPAAVIATDLDGDGAGDLAVLLVYTGWGQTMVTERSEMDGVLGFVEVMTVVPELLARRELWLWRGDGRGRLARAGEPLALPRAVSSLAAGPGGRRLYALTDEGVAEVVWDGSEVGGLALVERLHQRPLLAGSGVFVPGLLTFAELTGDRHPDLLLPTREALLVYAGEAEGFALEPVARVPLPAADGRVGPELELRYPLPEARDVTGDRLPDLVWEDPGRGWERPWVARGLGGGRFAAPHAPLPPRALAPWPRQAAPLHFGDLDGDGRAEVLVQQRHELPEGAGMRADIRDAESPRSTLRLFDTTLELAPAAAPAQTFEVRGHTFAGNGEIRLPGGLRDLDGDGRLDLVTLDLDISLPRLLGGLAAGRVALPMSFRVWCQRPDGTFGEVRGLDLSGKLRLDLRSMTLRDLPSFAGDFDGDGRADFVQLGRGRAVSIHTGKPRCAFPTAPDLAFELRQEPQHLGLVRVEDLDGDGRSDLMVIRAGTVREAGVTPPARLDLYLSGGGSG